MERTTRRTPKAFPWDRRGDVVAIVEPGVDADPNDGSERATVAGRVVARVWYDDYGVPRMHGPLDVNQDGVSDLADLATFAERLARFGALAANPQTWREAQRLRNQLDWDRDGAVLEQDGAAFAADLASRVGERFDARQTLGNLPLYAGAWWDAWLEVYHVRHRVLDPKEGRWLQRDPIGYAGGSNLYAYVGNQPGRYVDPLGLRWAMAPTVASDGTCVPPLNAGDGWTEADWHEIDTTLARGVDGNLTVRILSFGTGLGDGASLGLSVLARELLATYAGFDVTDEVRQDSWYLGGVVTGTLTAGAGATGAFAVSHAGRAAILSTRIVATELPTVSAAEMLVAGQTARVSVAGSAIAISSGIAMPLGRSRLDDAGRRSSSSVHRNQQEGARVRDAIAAREAPALCEQTFRTVGGLRRIDVLKQAGGETIGIDSKVGRVPLTTRVRQELARDWWLVRQGQVSKIRWEFSRSSVTGEIGPTRALDQKLRRLGFEIRVNE